MVAPDTRSSGLLAIRSEMARQHGDALASIGAAGDLAGKISKSIRDTGRILLLGMGASHAVGRAVEPMYRSLGYDAIAIPMSEELEQPLPIDGRTVLLTSQSGESGEIVRWFRSAPRHPATFGLTLDPQSTLARTVPCLIGAGGPEKAFAATRSLTVSLALQAAVLARLGLATEGLKEILAAPATPDIAEALVRFGDVRAVVTSGRRLQGLAEALALGLTELSRLPCFSMEGGQLRHGPMEMLGPDVGVVMFRGQDPTAGLVASLASAVVAAGSPLVVFDASGEAPIDGAATVTAPASSDFVALFRLLPAAQEFMLSFAASRVADVGNPVRSQKVTRIE
jgi:fructoselysine-6-P-deglycase FrlB-like protein